MARSTTAKLSNGDSKGLADVRSLLSQRQRSAYMTLLLTLGVLLVAARVSSDGATEHLTGVLRLPGLVTTLVLSLIAPLLTFRVVHATKEAFLAKGFGGRDLLKLSEDRIPESLGLPTSIVYCMLMCAYIPFRYGMRNTFTQQLASGNADGGWSGDMHGTSGFPHHEVSGSHALRACTLIFV